MTDDELLLDAVRRADPTAVRAALRSGADANASCETSVAWDRQRLVGRESVLHAAARTGVVDVVAALLAAGAEPHPRETVFGATPLREAAARGDLAVVERLLAAPERSPDLAPALEAALEGAHDAVAVALLRAGAAATQRTLELACHRGRPDLVECCLQRGAVLDAQPAFAAAARSGHVDMLRWLVDHGADLAAAGGEALGEAANAGHVAAVQFLLERGVAPGHRNAHGWSPLHFAAWQGGAATCEVLLRAGADPRAVDDAGKTALEWALEAGDAAAIVVLQRALAP